MFLEWILDNSNIKKFSSLHSNYYYSVEAIVLALPQSRGAKSSCEGSKDINDVSGTKKCKSSFANFHSLVNSAPHCKDSGLENGSCLV